MAPSALFCCAPSSSSLDRGVVNRPSITHEGDAVFTMSRPRAPPPAPGVRRHALTSNGRTLPAQERYAGSFGPSLGSMDFE